MNKKFLAVSVLGLLLLAGCGSSTSTPDGTMTPKPPVTDTPSNPNGNGGIVPPSADTHTQSFTVIGTNFAFAPSTLTVKKGDTVKITLKNANGFHDLKIDEFKVATKQIKAGESETITFTADKAGSFEYYCSFGNHRQMGMKGTLVVQ